MPVQSGSAPDIKKQSLMTHVSISLAWHVESLGSNGAGLLICDTRNEGLLDKLKSPRVHLTFGWNRVQPPHCQ